MTVAQGRVGRAAEIFDLMDGSVPPDAMFVARPNVISQERGLVDASVRFAFEMASNRVVICHGITFPLERWVGLTVDLSDANPDDSVVVD